MTVTNFYDPDPIMTSGNSMIGVATAIADIKNPTIAEMNSATYFECAIEKFGVGIKTKTTERQKLCDVIATKRLGSASYDDLPITFTIDPQATSQKLLDMLTVGSIVYLVHRPGIMHSDPVAAGQKVQVIKAIVSTRYLEDVTTKDGEEYEATVMLLPQEATDLFGTVKA